MRTLTLSPYLVHEVRQTKLQALHGQVVTFTQSNLTEEEKTLGSQVFNQQNATTQTPDWI